MPRVLTTGAILLLCLAGTAHAQPKAKERAATPIALNVSMPAILTRQDWRAKPALAGLKVQRIKGVILHNTGVRRNPGLSLENKMRGLQSFSQNPGMVSPGHSKPAWPDIPYHFYVDASGRIAEGRDVNFAGDTNTNYDTSGYIQVVVEGDFEMEAPSPIQLAATRDLVAWLLQSKNLPISSVSVHKAHAATDCPGRNFTATLPALLTQINQKISAAIRQ